MILETTEFVAFFLAGFYSAVALFYLVFAKLLKRKHQGQSMIHMGERFSRHWWNHLTFRLFRIAIWAACVLRLVFPVMERWLLPVASLQADWIALAGIGLLCFGFALAVCGSLSLAGAWRSGIDEDASDQLVTTQLYAFTRNPTFVGVRLAQLGFFLAWPTVFSLICLIVGWIAVSVQVELEEAHLQLRFGESYSDYKQAVGRWFLAGRQPA
jgi:protein-S-isoprenylcysteine O-methyltransferase Ste14